MGQNALPNTSQFAECVAPLLTNVTNLIVFDDTNAQRICYTDGAGDSVGLHISRSNMVCTVIISREVQDGPRSRTFTESTTTACVWTLLKELNEQAAV